MVLPGGYLAGPGIEDRPATAPWLPAAYPIGLRTLPISRPNQVFSGIKTTARRFMTANPLSLPGTSLMIRLPA